jgi:circadian clock protein KaiB
MKKKKTPSPKKVVRKPTGVRSTVRNQAQPKAEEPWMMRLYVAGQSTRSLAAIANLRLICDTYMRGRCTVEVIDLMRNRELAKADQIVAIPTLVRKLPEPARRIIGDLSATDKVLLSFELNPA